MLRVIFHIVIILIGSFFLEACDNPQPSSADLLEQAERLVDSYPDSAMQLIDSIFYPEKSLNRENHMRFLVTQVQTKYKTYRSISEDTLIFKARDYFSNRGKEPRMVALAWFYSGCVHRERQEYEQAMYHYNIARNYAAKNGDTDLQGLVQYNIGDLLAEQGSHKEALEYYKKAEFFYVKSPDKPHEKQARCFSAVGRMYMFLQQPDSAFRYFHKGLEIAEVAGDKNLQSLLSQNLSVAYTNKKQFDKAEIYLRQSYSLNADSAEIPRYYLNFAKLFTGIGQTDSVTWYKEQLKLHVKDSKTNNPLKASIYRFLAATEKEKENFSNAFNYQDEYIHVVEEIANARLQQSIYEIQRKYDYEMMKNRHERRVAFLQLWAIILLLAIVLGGSFFSWYTFRQKTKYLRTQQQIEILRGVAAELNKSLENKILAKEQDLRELLLWKFDVVKKSALLDQYSASKMNAAELVKIFHQIVYKGNKNGHWQNILSVFDQMNVGVSEKVKHMFPTLSETEYKIVLLTYAGMSVRDISVVLCISPNTVQTYRTVLRKKMGIDDLSLDTAIYLKEVFDN